MVGVHNISEKWQVLEWKNMSMVKCKSPIKIKTPNSGSTFSIFDLLKWSWGESYKFDNAKVWQWVYDNTHGACRNGYDQFLQENVTCVRMDKDIFHVWLDKCHISSLQEVWEINFYFLK